MKKQFREIDKGPMELKPVVTTMKPDTLSFDDKMQALE